MNKNRRLALEIIFFIVIYFAYQTEGFSISKNELFISSIMYLLLYGHALINRFLLWPLVFKQKKYIQYIAASIVLLFVFSIIIYNLNLAFSKIYLPQFTPFITFYNSVTSSILSLFVMSSIEFVFQYIHRETEKINFQAQIDQLENANLKAQLNPHFLFNSLNNAYGISLSDPKRAPDYIMQLSQLMRYQLESVKHEKVNLKEELKFIENYIAIENERIGQRCKITFINNIDSTTINNEKIVPMIFSTFIENAIKHGAASIDAAEIKINFSNKANRICFEIINTKPSIKVNTNGTQLGIQNVKKRLELMYPNQYILNIFDEVNLYKVQLTLHL
jgi:two-component system, LytTR family, sensor kinase